MVSRFPYVAASELIFVCSEQRFFAAGYLEDHKIRREKKSSCPDWCVVFDSKLVLA